MNKKYYCCLIENIFSPERQYFINVKALRVEELGTYLCRKLRFACIRL